MSARYGLIVCFALTLAGCGGTVPMTVFAGNGHTFRGTYGGAFPTPFAFSDGRVTCSGKMPSILPGGTHVLTVPVACKHGLTGIVTFHDIATYAGGGSLRLSDGTEGSFIMGEGAAAL